MAEPSELEHMAQAADMNQHGHEKKEEKKQLTTLESVVEETTHGIGNIIKLGLAGAIPYFFANSFPSLKRDTYILSGAQVASDITISYKKDKKYTAGNFLESTALGTAMTPVLEGMFGTVNSMPLNTTLDYVAKAGVWGGVCYPAFVAAYQPIAYFIRNRTFKGMGKYIKENYWSTLKQSWKTLLPISLLNVFFAPLWLQIPISAALSYVFDLFGAPQKEEVSEDQKRDKTPYPIAALNVTSKLVRNTIGGFYNGLYDLGRAIGGGYSSSQPSSAPTPAQSRPTPTPTMTPAPAH